MLLFDKLPNWKVLELGNGGVRHPMADVRVDSNYQAGLTDFAANLHNPPWPEIGDQGFDVVFCSCLEQLTDAAKAPAFLAEVKRILKPSGRLLFVAENYDVKPRTTEMEIIPALRLTPATASLLLAQAGFASVTISPYTDDSMVLEAFCQPPSQPEAPPALPAPTAPTLVPPALPTKPAAEIYNRAYFDNYQGGGFIWDYPNNEVIFRKALSHLSPTSLIELGCGRGYILKRFQDHPSGIKTEGIDVSRHAWLTRVCDPIINYDLTRPDWPVGKKEFDVAFSHLLLEHIPEPALESFCSELERISRRGLHIVTVEGGQVNHDSTRCTLRSLDWWRRILPTNQEVVDVREVSSGELPEEYVQGDGRIKLNIGCAWTMFYGWQNLDVIDARGFAQSFHYTFKQHDVRQGIPYQTGVVDRIFTHHFLEHLTYEEIKRFLKEARRVIRPDGTMRIVVPDTEELAHAYACLPGLKEYDEVNGGCAQAPTPAGKLWALLGEGHKSFLDAVTLGQLLLEAGWTPYATRFRTTEVPAVNDILVGCSEMSYGNLSLFVDAIPAQGEKPLT